MAAQLRQVGRQSRPPKAVGDTGTQLVERGVILLHRGAQDVAHFVLHAPRVPFGASLQLFGDVVFQVPHHELSHRVTLRRDDITISKPVVIAPDHRRPRPEIFHRGPTALTPATTSWPLYYVGMANVYFELTEAFNADRPTAALASGQAVVFYRVAIMSKDGDWIIRESPDACARVLTVLEARGARYRPAAPLDPRWLAGGWSSHFEFFDDRRRRVRCDFVSRPPRVGKSAVDATFDRADAPLFAVDVETLIRLKQTQRAKDYAVISALAAKLPVDREIEFTTDPDRVLALTAECGPPRTRPAIAAAATQGDRRALVVAIAVEIDDLQQLDRRRVERYEAAAAPYLAECRTMGLNELSLPEAHARLVDAAHRLLPLLPEAASADAQ